MFPNLLPRRNPHSSFLYPEENDYRPGKAGSEERNSIAAAIYSVWHLAYIVRRLIEAVFLLFPRDI